MKISYFLSALTLVAKFALATSTKEVHGIIYMWIEGNLVAVTEERFKPFALQTAPTPTSKVYMFRLVNTTAITGSGDQTRVIVQVGSCLELAKPDKGKPFKMYLGADKQIENIWATNCKWIKSQLVSFKSLCTLAPVYLLTPEETMTNRLKQVKTEKRDDANGQRLDQLHPTSRDLKGIPLGSDDTGSWFLWTDVGAINDSILE